MAKDGLVLSSHTQGRRSGPKSGGGGGAEAGGRDECGGVGVFDKEYPC